MKEKRSYKRFNLLSTLAALGVLVILLFEGVFVFELYHVKFSLIEPYLPDAVKPSVERWLSSPQSVEESVVAAPADAKEPLKEEPALVPEVVEEPIPVKEAEPVEEESVPVG